VDRLSPPLDGGAELSSCYLALTTSLKPVFLFIWLFFFFMAALKFFFLRAIFENFPSARVSGRILHGDILFHIFLFKLVLQQCRFAEISSDGLSKRLRRIFRAGVSIGRHIATGDG
jgi:hypothetical protein